MGRAPGVGAQAPHAAHEDRRFGGRQVQQGRLLHQHLGRRPGGAAGEVVAEPVRGRLEQGEGVHVGPFLRGVHAPRREGDPHVETGPGRRPLDGGGSAEHDQVGQGDPLAVRLRAVEVAADAFQGLQHAAQLRRVVRRPVLLGRETNAPPVGAAAHVGPAERRRRGPGGPDQLGRGQPGIENRRFQAGRVLRVDQRVVDFGDRVLPGELPVGREGAEVARPRTQVAVRQLEPRAGEGVFELFGVLQPARRDLAVDGVLLQREVGGEHHRRVPARRVVGVGHQRRGGAVGGLPLDGAGRAARRHPLVAVQVLQEVVRPGGGVRGPRALQAAGDRVAAVAGAVAVPPAEPLLFDACALRLDVHVLPRIGGPVGLAEGMAAGDQRRRLLVVHRHAAEGLADGVGRRPRIGVAARTLGIHVDQAHLRGAEGRMQPPVLAAPVGAEPLALRSPVHVFGPPGVDAAARETQGLEAHRLHGHGAREDQQVGPGNRAAVLLLERPEQAVRLVQVGVVGPTVEGREALQAAVGAAPAVDGAVGARAVPGHADEERPVVAVVGRPPVLGGGHQFFEVGLEDVEVDALERLRVVEVAAEGIGVRRGRAQRVEVQPVGPPVVVVGRAVLGGGGAGGQEQRDPDRQQGNGAWRSPGHLSRLQYTGVRDSTRAAAQGAAGNASPPAGSARRGERPPMVP